MRIYLDTNALIAALEGADPIAELVRDVLRTVRSARTAFVTSELTLAELLVDPLREGDARRIEAVHGLFGGTGELTAAPVSREVLLSAADLRARHRPLKLPDAIHLATAQLEHCSAILSNDDRLPRLPALSQFHLRWETLADLLAEIRNVD